MKISDKLFKEYLCWMVDNEYFGDFRYLLINELSGPDGVENMIDLFLRIKREEKLRQLGI